MKRIFSLSLVTILLVGCGSSTKTVNDFAVNTPIVSDINISKVVDDKVPVTINPGRFTQETVIYRLPRVVQGTYSVSDFGRYVDDFKALDYKGEELWVTKTDVNTWTIDNATQLDKITYLVNDTFDVEQSGGIGGEHPFSPSGTNISPENYVLNLHGFIGYFDSLKSNQYKLNITAPNSFDRTSALQSIGVTVDKNEKDKTTHYFAPRYFDLTDNPMMYGNLDVEEFTVGNIKIVLSVYSPNKVHTAAKIKETVFKMMKAQKAYLGDINSTPRYDIYLYLSEGKDTSPKGFGALEHHTSTVVVLPESMPFETLEESMIDVVSHEFFHIVTPLSVHSEDVHYFDYNQPTFSKHLWMYEGVTEYFASIFQIDQDLVNEDEFYAKIMSKIKSSRAMMDDMSFTKMSENVLDEPYASQYYNVYQKGALIGMCIDILMREESNGNRGILSLMKELSNKYGKNKPFEDDKIIDEITVMTYPSVGNFLKKHVIGTESSEKSLPINYNKFLKKVGLTIVEDKVEANYILHGQIPIVSGSQEKGIFFTEMAEDNSFWAAQGVKANDVIKEVNGKELTVFNANEIFQEVFGWQEGQEISVKLMRNGKEVLINTTTEQPYMPGTKIIEDKNATNAQKDLRNAWLKG